MAHRSTSASAQTVGRVVLRWESAYGPAYRIEVSTDGTHLDHRSASTTTGDGGVDNVTLRPGRPPATCGMHGVTRATSYGYSLYEFEVYAH